MEIWKVHGSLDWFKEPEAETIVAIPVGQEPPTDLLPLIVPPGLTKYQETHQEPFRTVLDRADRALINANGFFCVGYGFNDEHIHPKLIPRVRRDKKPIVVLAKQLTEKTRAVLFNGHDIRFVAMEEIEHVGTKIYTYDYKDGVDIAGPAYWDFRHFVKEVL